MGNIPKPWKGQGNDIEDQPITTKRQKARRLPDGRIIVESGIEVNIDPRTGTHITNEISDTPPDGVCENLFGLHEPGKHVYHKYTGEQYPEGSGRYHCYECMNLNYENYKSNCIWGWIYKKPTIEEAYNENQ